VQYSDAGQEICGTGTCAVENSSGSPFQKLFQVALSVEHGDHRGRTIGFPTANVAVPGDIALPSDGVYAGWYERPSGERHEAAINLGKRPTFYDENGMRLLEAHLLDFDGDLYTEHAKVRFQTWLRGEVKFGSVDALVDCLRHDVEDARRALSPLRRP